MCNVSSGQVIRETSRKLRESKKDFELEEMLKAVVDCSLFYN